LSTRRASSSITVAALAGRRIDNDGTETARFPSDHVDIVRGKIAERLLDWNSVALVCSAACGADLVALDVAQQMGLRTRIVLPFSTERFRETSVVDRARPHYWGDLFDSVTAKARETNDLIELSGAEGDDAAYLAANAVILNEARSLANLQNNPSSSKSLIALIVWDGVSHGPTDATKLFADLAQRLGFTVDQLQTLNVADSEAAK
jgi:hypothetical protein